MEKKPRKLSEEQRSRLREVLSNYVKQKQSGAGVSRSKLLKANPDISPEILAWFKKQQSKSAEAKSTTEESAESIDETVLVNGPLAQNAEFGRYRLLSVLGEGAMGVVYLAKDTKLGRQVALKVPKRTAIDDDEFMGRFEREAKTAAALSHKNICRVFDAGEHNGMAYITMDFIDGVPLSDLIGTARLESLDVILTMTGMIAGALQHAHENDILHRDLKPGNIIVNSKLVPCVTDFGLARQITSDGATELTHEGTVLGTPAYMAPEQIRGERANIGPQSDIYSLGVVLFQMLTGQLPFTGSLPEVFAKSLRDNPPLPSQLRQDLPVNVEDLCLKMLKKDPANRFRSMDELQSAIDKVRKKSPPSVASRKGGKTVSTKNFDTTKAKVHALIKKGRYAAATRELDYFSQEDRPEYAELSAWAKETLVKVRKESRALSPKGLKALLQTGREMFQKHDYRGCIQLLSDIPVLHRSDGIEQLLQNATDAEANAEELMLEIKKKERKEEIRGLDRLVKQFLKLKPQNKYARRLSAALQSYGEASAGRHKYSFENGRLVPYEKQTFVGEWLIKGALVGTLVFSAMFVYVNNYLTSDDDAQVADASSNTVPRTKAGGLTNDTPAAVSKPDTLATSQVIQTFAVAPYSLREAQDYQRAAADELGVPATITNETGMTFNLVPPGRFLMGSSKFENGRVSDEGPQRKVTITSALYFQTTEVTEQQWQSVMLTQPWVGSEFNRSGPDYPARNMSHAEAAEFCEKLSAREGHNYRLPTEAEWEQACRAGSTLAWYCGDNGRQNDHAWWGGQFGSGNCKDEQYAHQVQQKRSNAFGLYDVCGNVQEWCSDHYQEDYYANAPKIDPQGPTTGDDFVIRGGSWNHRVSFLRSANRGFAPPEGRFDIGFRVVREAGSVSPQIANASTGSAIKSADSSDSSKTQTTSADPKAQSDGLELNSKLTIISQIQGGTKAQLDTWSKKLPQGDRPYWISRRTKGTEVRFDGLARTAPSDREWRIDYLDLEKDAEKYRSIRGPVTPAIINDSATESDAHHQILWVKNLPGQVYSNLWGLEGFARDEMQRDFRKPRDMPGPQQFLLPIHISATYDKGIGKISYHMCQALIPYPGVEFRSNLTAAEVRAQLPDYFDRNWQLHLLTGIVNSPTQQFAAVFVDRGASRVPWSVTMNLSAEKYAEALLKIDAIGGWPRCVSSGDYGDGLKFHVVWDNVGNKKLAAVDVVDGS